MQFPQLIPVSNQVSISLHTLTSGAYSVEKSEGTPFEGWKQVFTGISDLTVTEETSPAQAYYRVKSTPGSSHRLSASIVTRSNLLFSFQILPGWDHQLQVQSSTLTWTNVSAGPITRNPYTLSNPPAAETFRIIARPPIIREDHEAIFIGGQSNAELSDSADHPIRIPSVLYLNRDFNYTHPSAYHPAFDDFPFAYSFSVEAARQLSAMRARPFLLVPVASGSTSIPQWTPASNRFDQATLFGRSNFRRVIGAPHYRAIWYYGHESSTPSPHYIAEWKALMNEFLQEIGPVPVIFAQLAKSTDQSMHAYNFSGAERQRLTEASEIEGNPSHHMVVTFDLPLGDAIHLSGAAQRELGRRFALATRQHVYGEAINGTGPRLESIRFSETNRAFIEVRFNHRIVPPINNYDNQFRVSAGGENIPIASITRAPNLNTVTLQLTSSPQGEIFITYGEPRATATLQMLTNVVRDFSGLPAPAFGPLKVQ